MTATAEAPAEPDDEPVASFLDRPLTSLHLILVSTGLLLGLGLVMVLSASMVKSYQETGSAYSVFTGQAVWVALAVPAFWLGVRFTPRMYRRLAYPGLLVSLVLLAAVLVPGVGLNLNGAQRWLDVGPLQMQPAELAKLALALWGADLLVRKQRLLGQARHLVMPLVPVAALMAAFVVLEPDLGTSMCFAMVLFGLLWTVGAPGRIFGALLGLAGVVVAGLAVMEPYRFARVTHFLDPSADPTGAGFQPLLGLSSLSSGGWFGVGLGQGRAKWLNLPEAHTDYIFAVIGEELGLVGGLIVLLLYATLAYAGLRIARRTADPFARLAAAGVTVWIVGQAVLNIGYVSGLLPVTGVPLPLISAGGTSLLVTVFALGMLASFARHEPDAVAQLGTRGRVAKLLGLPAPRLPRERPRRRTSPARGRGVDRTGDRGGRRVSVPPPRTAGSARPSRQTSPRREARRR
ncbi:MAG TPA: putative lipid II flippase FtsW [Mycobacteriales bacterium]|nr:putative lipid II flippase FtsW [Mycobacteriales bacterium]